MNVTQIDPTESTAATSSIDAADVPRRILIVDDNAVDRSHVVRTLRKRLGELTVVEADTGAEALLALLQQPFDVVLVDYLLPDMDGLDVLSTVAREFPGAARILLSGQGNEMVATQAMKRGAQDYLIKRDLSAMSLERALVQAVRAVRLVREHARLFDELQRARQETGHLVRALSHDLGAMFRMLESSLRQLRRACRDEDAAEREEAFLHVDAIVRESRHFLDDLVTLGKTGAIDMEPSPVDLRTMIGEVLFEQDELIHRREATVRVGDQLPSVWCNPQRVKQILTNLLRNALRHARNDQGLEVTIALAARPTSEADERRVWLTVADNGQGIPEAERAEIFLPGRRLSSADAEGSGMGLAIVKKIVDHYGGRIFVSPDAVPGAAFVFSLPAMPASAETKARQSAVRSLAGAASQLHRSLSQAVTPLPE